MKALEKDLFFGRERDFERLEKLARDSSRGWGRSLFLWSAPGMGKTELLRQFYLRLFEEAEDILPFYYQMPRLKWELTDFAADYAISFAAHYLAFRRRDLSFLNEGSRMDRIADGLKIDGSPASRYLLEMCRYLGDYDSRRSPAAEAALLPGGFAEESGLKVISMIDDFPNLAAYSPAELVTWPREAICSRKAPVIMAGRHPDGLQSILDEADRAGAVGIWRLAPLSSEGAVTMARCLSRVAGVEMSEELTGRAVMLTGGVPCALGALVRSLVGKGAVDEASLFRAYAAVVCRGEIHDYWMDMLRAAFPGFEERRTAIEVLVTCLREKQPLEAGALSAHMLKSAGEVEGALLGLSRSGLLRVDCSRIRVSEDPTLRDFVFSLYRMETGGKDSGLVEASLAADKVEASGEEDRRVRRRAVRERLRDLLESWSGQEVPKIIFSAYEFSRRFGGTKKEDAISMIEKEKEVITLPEVVSVASGFIGPQTGPPFFEADAVAWAFMGMAGGQGRKICWVVGIFDSGEVDQDDVEEFERCVSALQTGGELESVNTVKWMIAVDRFTPEAASRAESCRICTSTRSQLNLLDRLLGRDKSEVFSVPRGQETTEGRLEFEMSIPMVSETELVAAKAVEQLAESMKFDPTEIGRIKMALVEACINAFEHSGLEGEKVRLRFTVQGDSLTIRVENRGKSFVPQKIARAGNRGEMAKRGWGLSLIRELMDEVEFETRDEGASLTMVKHMRGKEESGGQF